MTDVKMKALNLSNFDKVERLVNNIGKTVATRVFMEEGKDMKEFLQSQISGSTASWGKGIDGKKASDSLAAALVLQPGEGNVKITFKDGTHPETGQSFKEAAAGREKVSPFRKKAVEAFKKRKQEIGDKVMKEQSRLIQKGIK